MQPEPVSPQTMETASPVCTKSLSLSDRTLGVCENLSTDLYETARNGVQEIAETHARGQAESSRHIRIASWFLILAAVSTLALNASVFGWAIYRASTMPTVVLSQPVIAGPTALCPGETLDYSFIMSVSRAALVELKTSVQRLEPGTRISYARLQEFDFDEATDMNFVRHWVVPNGYADPVTGQEITWPPGDYAQITIANVAGRGDTSEIQVGFSIREDCN